ncbi:unnamed protein product [Phaeothamnion confervicola]
MATLYVCGQGTKLASVHPCGKAARALDEAGVTYELATAEGYRRVPWMRAKRAAIRELSGQIGVPVLVTDEGVVINGSAQIIEWARERTAVRG